MYFSQAGKSEPSRDSTSVRTTAKGVAPTFDGRRQEVVVLVGEDAKLKVPLQAEPKPTITWLKSGREISGAR